MSPRTRYFILQHLLIIGLFSLTFPRIFAQTDTTVIDSPPPPVAQPSFSLDSAFNPLPPDSSRTQKGPANRQQLIIDSLQQVSQLKASVSYKAQDSIVYDIKSNQLILYSSGQNMGQIDYDDLQLKAAKIQINVDDQSLYAEGIEDKEGDLQGQPEFTQDGETVKSRTVAYNFNTQKGRATGGRIVQGDGFILADVTKYQEDGSLHGLGGKYTSCDLDHPHYYISAQKIKVLPNQQIITGPLRLVIADVPLPIIVPFGFLPNQKKGQKNGLILPQYGNSDTRGLFLRGIGYYWDVNDFLGITFNSDLYSRGGWLVGATANYKIKYKYSGTIGFDYTKIVQNERGDPDFSRTLTWKLRWQHNQPINPTARFSASVNFSNSNQFQRQATYNLNDVLSNDVTSSISFQKRFNNLPFSLSVNANHRQDLSDGTMSLDAPSINLSMTRQTPFKNVDNEYLGFLKQLGFTYRMDARNSIPTVQDSLFFDVLFQTSDTISFFANENDTALTRRPVNEFFNNGARHSIQGNTSIKLFKYLNIPISFDYQDLWYTERTLKVWDAENEQVVTSQVPGFIRAFDYSANVNATTVFYGIYGFKRSRRQTAFRQQFNLSMGYTYQPDFSTENFGFYDKVQTDATGENFETYSIFSGGIYGSPGNSERQSITFGLGSSLEMKTRKKESFEPDFDESQDKFIRSKIIDNIRIGTSYNLAADSLQLAPISLSARTRLFNNKLAINASSTFDPYVYGAPEVSFPIEPISARKLNQFLIVEEGRLARLTSARLSLTTSFRSKKPEKRGVKTPGFDAEEFAYIQQNYNQYYDFSIPWSVNLNYNFSYSRNTLAAPTIRSTVNVSGDFNFTPNWKVGYTTGFDMVSAKATTTSITITRPLHCWQFSFRWVPFGEYKSYSLVISVRSATLSALRLTKNQSWQDQFSTL
ncbi:MAG: putative LPS assembly protein LptD [Bacteroidota bacterium]